MQTQYSEEMYLSLSEQYLSRLATGLDKLALGLQNNNSYNQTIIQNLKKNADALKATTLTTNRTQAQIDELNTLLGDTQDNMYKLIKNTDKVVKKNSKNKDPLALQLVKQQQEIHATTNRLVEQHANLRDSLGQFKGPIPSVKTGDPVQNKTIKGRVRDERDHNIQLLGLLKQIDDLKIKIPTVAPVKTFDTSKAQASAQQSFFEKYGDKLVKAFSALAIAGQGCAQAIQDMVSQMGKAQATIFQSIGDILDNPIQQIIGVIQGIGQALAQAFQMISNIVNQITEGISSILSSQKDNDGKQGSIFTKILGVVGNLISSLISMVVQQIQAGFNIFTSVLTAIFKILKRIQMSSPIIQQILELINLAFNLFFMPFMNAFGLQMLDGVVKILNWAFDTGKSFQQIGSSLISILEQQGFSVQDIQNFVKELATEFVTEYLPEIIKLLPSVTTFALDFVSEILNHSGDIIDFIKAGLGAFKQLMDEGILGDFLSFGKTVMKWIKDNGKTLVDFLEGAMNQALGLSTFFLNFITAPNTGSIDALLEGDLNEMWSIIVGEFNDQLDLSKHDQFQDVLQSSGAGNLVPNYADLRMYKRGYENLSTIAGVQDWLWTQITNPIQDGIDWLTDTLSGAQAQNGGKFTTRQYNNGIPVLAGEQNEGEFRLNEKELMEIGKDTTVTIQYNGSILTRSDFKAVVQDVVSDVSNKSHFR